ncbi:transcriptional regulator [Microlunatus endophyticus]|uniref:Transcriptional regulator n=1 Tax=Microlunatus endophyticus TaxID=1716077 RepID=A0A917SKT4_9ACTN|nr:MarR family transcriptional regulator [Microlunatus endophyticus]GGL83690.1 transcriptional regulator [Microlunatus endophyticus]
MSNALAASTRPDDLPKQADVPELSDGNIHSLGSVLVREPEVADHAHALRSVEDGIGQLVLTMRARWRELAHQLHPALQPIGFRIILVLYGRGPQRAKDLAEYIGSDRSVVSRQLAQLEKFGLIERHVDPNDGRIIHMAITAATQGQLQHLEASDGADYRRRLSGWSVERLRNFAGMLRDFSAASDE